MAYFFSKHKSVPTLAPIEEWIWAIKDIVEVQRLGSEPSNMIELIALFEKHPDPADCLGVDYQAIYFYIAALLEVLL